MITPPTKPTTISLDMSPEPLLAFSGVDLGICGGGLFAGLAIKFIVYSVHSSRCRLVGGIQHPCGVDDVLLGTSK